jgi:hypothetical protein
MISNVPNHNLLTLRVCAVSFFSVLLMPSSRTFGDPLSQHQDLQERACLAGNARVCWSLAHDSEDSDCQRSAALYLRAWRLDTTLDMSRLIYACIDTARVESLCRIGSRTACGVVGYRSLRSARGRHQQRIFLRMMVDSCAEGASAICEILDPVINNFTSRYSWFFDSRRPR